MDWCTTWQKVQIIMSECGAEASIWPDYNEGFPVEWHISWVGCCQAISEEVEVCVGDDEPHPFCAVTMGFDPLLRSSWHPASEDSLLTSLFKSCRQGSGHRILYHYSNFILCSCKTLHRKTKLTCFENRRGIRLKLSPLWTQFNRCGLQIVTPNMWHICLQYTPNKAHSLFLRPYVQCFFFPPKKKQQKKMTD